ncbi:MAG: mechanosensitive ion channel [Ignavibacteriaceae bacterium]|jgi:miniconductance mechanosensitive channel|nr:MAG: mechanosensitive ion channel family protein [Chlorobiota bacterium]KXK06252.1 MAG: MscS Mechanosensitive ion channel [Chlorobi bacterium OLB4]MBV6399236.1 hypothetical protein [Ignavibacteria bacterium]MCC6884909.1 mechanosensitive ion channel [Ignavibacteriales bacterium]MCE7953560.1 mechanosensitive ion channel family protein [Chlorobi bacterium CHB7]MDL1887550.1 mechanosensitive ion channel [Ignavibacteria bacterium CHB1]MEB2329322.1 mechanosensitive ion channel [Ignavibacteriaceae
MKYYRQYSDWIKNHLAGIGLDNFWVNFFATVIDLILLVIICVLTFHLTKLLFIQGLKKLADKLKIPGREEFRTKKVIVPLAHITPAFVIKAFIPEVFESSPGYISFFSGLTDLYIIISVTVVLGRFISAVSAGLNKLPVFRDKPVKSYSQLIVIIIWLIAVVLVFSVILNKSPIYLLGALGAMTAVLLLVFKDTLLGFVASIQISAYDMMKPGDWITMPKHDADGDVISINLNTVVVRNFDKTIVMIPTYAFISESFRNWRGMVDSKGRRIKRSLYVNVNSIKFCTKEMLIKFREYELIREYIQIREKEIDEFNEERNINKSELINGRNLTNVGIFRKYIEAYLRNNPDIRQEKGYSLIVRQLEPTEKGLPLEIYAFTNTTDWVIYEAIQSDIFDHLLSSAKNFGLTLFQSPTGADIRALKEKE